MRFNGKKIPEDLAFKNLLPPLDTLRVLSFFIGLSEILSYNKQPELFSFNFLENGSHTLQITHPSVSYLTKEKLKKLTLPKTIQIELC